MEQVKIKCFSAISYTKNIGSPLCLFLMEKKKLFIAVGFDEHFQNLMAPWIKKIRTSIEQREVYPKWTAPNNYHVTLVYLGETEIERIPAIEKALINVANRHDSFSLKIRGLSAFPSLQSGRVIYLGVQRSQALLNLQSDLEGLLVPPEKVEFDYSPHLTIARLRNPQSCQDMLSPFNHLDLKKQLVTKVSLFENVLEGNFPSYKELYTADLNESPLELE
jgi:RNA 2',3'-cyclic 3'-phosphodiesterase